MNKQNKWYLAIGAGLGLAAGYYSNTQKGTELQANAVNIIASKTSRAKMMLENQAALVSEKTKETLDSVNRIVDTATNKGKDYISKIESNTISGPSDIESLVVNELTDLNKN